MEYDGWEVLKDDNDPQKEKKLGKGGQGTVYLARSPQSVTKRRTAAQQVRNMLGQLPSGRYEASDLAAALSLLGGPEGPLNLAALKVFDISSEGPEEQAKAIARLTSEINALKAINHPAVLKLLHSNIARRCMVTQYHPRGPLSKNLHLFKGNSLAALKAFSQLLAGVDAIHKQGAIHRDIKTDNIFVAESGELVLGDFGIVFFQEGDRWTSTFERVGTRGWMAPWAQENLRLLAETINAKLDIYPLAKVLWSMISGRDGFQFWDYDSEANNLEKLFPHNPGMVIVNNILRRSIVREEKNCFYTSIEAMQKDVADAITLLANTGQRFSEEAPWLCQICGRGYYFPTILKVMGYIGSSNSTTSLRTFACSNCWHTEMFVDPRSTTSHIWDGPAPGAP